MNVKKITFFYILKIYFIYNNTVIVTRVTRINNYSCTFYFAVERSYGRLNATIILIKSPVESF